jgi:hypothetical protein
VPRPDLPTSGADSAQSHARPLPEPASLRRPRVARLGAALFLVAIATACTLSAQRIDWEEGLARAEHLLNTDEYAAADEAYAALQGWAPTGSDERYVTLMRGMVAERQGDLDGAVAQYLSLLEHHGEFAESDEYTPRGIYRLGRIYYWELDDREQGLRFFDTVLRYYPDVDGPAHRALDAIIYHFEESGEDAAAVDYFAARQETLAQTRMGDNMLYWRAYWYAHHVGAPDVAVPLFEALRADYSDSSLRDDAEWQLVHIYHEAGEFEREVELLHEMRRQRAEALIFGPEATGSMEQAAVRMGTVLLEDIGDPARAIVEWRDFLDVWSLSLERDDVMYGIVRATAQLGDRAALRQVADEFRRDYPESRYLDEVEALAGGGGGS